MPTRGLWVLLLCAGQVLNEKTCEDSKSCQECVTNSHLCQWCPAEKFELDNRCRSASNNKNLWCPGAKIQNPVSTLKIVEQNDFNSTLGHTVQLKPQMIHLELRVGVPQSFDFMYKAAEDYPVDIYFLLDASQSMDPLKQDLQDQSQNIYHTMTHLTRNVHFGLGTFIDKNMLPFNDQPTNGKAYSFKHELDLTNDLDAFQGKLKGLDDRPGSPNIDNPESGFDGIAQVIACKERIKWREQSRKIIVLMTDASYHAAGDGRSSGIIHPYDGKCYLNEKGFYDIDQKLDYPSVGIIRNMAVNEQITIIFNAQVNDDSVYHSLQSRQKGFFYMKYEEQKMTKELKKIYEGITENINLQVSMPSQVSEHLTVSLEPNCRSAVKINECSVQKGQEKRFRATIKLDNYFGMKNFNVSINPKGLREHVRLNINVITGCPCDKVAQENSTLCSNAGKWSCGICECLEKNTGPTCSCAADQSECRRSSDHKDCSGNGICLCNQCTCHPGYGGKYCQILLDNCPRGVGFEICSGHGNCQDGECLCDRGYTGELCDCPTPTKACTKHDQLCSGRGWCQCGNCECDGPEKWDVRPRDEFCDVTTCIDCHNKQCRHLIACEECLQRGTDCSDACGEKMIVIKHDIPEDIKGQWNYCFNIRVDFGCYANYSYIYNANDTITLFMLQRSCEESQLYIGMICLAVLVLAGLATLVAWKLLTGAQDRREYEHFKKAIQAVDQTQENDIYKSPCTTYRNPAFEPSTDE